jgi:HSP20 family molecular chaperone IbpA
VTAEVPGIDPANVDITVHGDALTIALKSTDAPDAEKSPRQVISRTVHLPFTIDAQKTEATCQHGILTVHLQQPESEKPKNISIKVS